MPEINDQQFQGVAEQVKDIIKFDDAEEAFGSIKLIQDFLAARKLETANPALFAAYNDLITQLKWVAMIHLKEDDVANLFKNDLVDTFSMEYFDLWEKFRSYLVGEVIAHEDRDVFKEKIKNVLNKCQTRLTADKLANGNAPTIENWIKDYTASVGLGPVDSVKMQNYFSTSANIKKLKRVENERVAAFFKFYEKLKLSSFTLAGVEESVPVPIDDKGTMGHIREGKIERDAPLPQEVQKILAVVEGTAEKEATPVSAAANNKKAAAVPPNAEEEGKMAELRQVAAKYPPHSLQRKAVDAEIKKLSKK
jgi:hypothetical protein